MLKSGGKNLWPTTNPALPTGSDAVDMADIMPLDDGGGSSSKS